MSVFIKDIRRRIKMTQREFAGMFGIPVSTLRKWEQGESSPPRYVIDLIIKSLPEMDDSLRKIEGRDGCDYYFDRERKQLADSRGNRINIDDNLEGVKEANLGLYVSDLFNDFYIIQEKFNRDCTYDRKEDIMWV